MPRYLQKLVARAVIAPPPALLQPAFRSGADVGESDPLHEEAEPLPPQSLARSEGELPLPPAVATSSLAPLLPAVSTNGENIAPSSQVIREQTTERIFENRVEPQILLKTSPSSAEKPQPPGLHDKPPQQALPETKQRPGMHARISPLQTTADRPADVLSTLIPRLEAWFKQPTAAEKQVESHAPEASLAPPRRETETAPPLHQEESRLVIGQIRVDIATPAPVPVPSPRVVRIPARSAQSPAVTGSIAKLGYGLGQM